MEKWEKTTYFMKKGAFRHILDVQILLFKKKRLLLQYDCGCSVMAARKTSDLDSAYLQCAGAGSIPVTRS